MEDLAPYLSDDAAQAASCDFEPHAQPSGWELVGGARMDQKTSFWGLRKPCRVLAAEIIGSEKLFELDAAGIQVLPRLQVRCLSRGLRAALQRLKELDPSAPGEIASQSLNSRLSGEPERGKSHSSQPVTPSDRRHAHDLERLAQLG